MPQDNVINQNKSPDVQESDQFDKIGTTKEELFNRIKDLEKRVQALEAV